jgi:hypothetical protein
MSSRNDHFLSAQLILIEPSIDELQRLLDAVKVAGEFEYDNHILNNLYGDSAIVLPHRPYNILTREFRNENEDHRKYLGSDKKEWDPEKELRDAKFLHFSDWPITPKPWLGFTRRIEDTAPHCVDADVEHDLDCKSQLLWLGFYNDYRTRRKVGSQKKLPLRLSPVLTSSPLGSLWCMVLTRRREDEKKSKAS